MQPADPAFMVADLSNLWFVADVPEDQAASLHVGKTEGVVSCLGRGESPADPAGPNEADVIANLVPVDKRPRDLTQQKIADQMREALSHIPGINLVMSQPISDRVDEMVTGVRADVAVKIFGDDLDTLREKAQEVAKVASSIQGTQSRHGQAKDRRRH